MGALRSPSPVRLRSASPIRARVEEDGVKGKDKVEESPKLGKRALRRARRFMKLGRRQGDQRSGTPPRGTKTSPTRRAVLEDTPPTDREAGPEAAEEKEKEAADARVTFAPGTKPPRWSRPRLELMKDKAKGKGKDAKGKGKGDKGGKGKAKGVQKDQKFGKSNTGKEAKAKYDWRWTRGSRGRGKGGGKW